MNFVRIEPAPPGTRAAAGRLELGAGSLLAYAMEVAAGEAPGALPALDNLRQALEAERERMTGLLPSLPPEEIADLLADLLSHLSHALAAVTPAACVLALSTQGAVHIVASDGAAASLVAAAVATAAAPPSPEMRGALEAEIATLRREVERRLVRLDGRVKEVEDFALGRAATPGRARFAFPGLPALTRPRPALVRRPLPGSPEDLASADNAPAFERGLDVPVASNWSRPLLLVTGGVTLILFLSMQLFCARVPRRRVVPPPKAVPAATAPAVPGTPASKPPVGVLLVTPSSEPEGTEGAGAGPSESRAPRPPR